MNTTGALWLEPIDTLQFGQPGSGAVYLVRGERTALVESGTPTSATRLAARLRDEDLSHIFVTHVHLDHGGGAGILAADHPEAVVITHPRGVPHLVDPRRLAAGARDASPDLYSLYGEPRPIPTDQVLPANDGDRFDLGRGITLEVIQSPGHAPHHLCFFERSARILFCGDAAGNHGTPVDVPLTVPPRFDLARGIQTIQRLRELRPSVLAFTHFGLAPDAPSVLDRYEAELVAWFRRINEMRRGKSSEQVVAEILSASEYARLSAPDRMLVEMCVRGALLSLSTQTC
jgi:glyoxylase-like metal-dependent hydrolase (beta-lactamase superfamily II)